MNDLINNPAHYTMVVPEVQYICDVLERYNKANWRYISAFQYLVRAPFKGNEVDDLKKCIWYLEHGAASEWGVFAEIDVSRLPGAYRDIVSQAARGRLRVLDVTCQLGAVLAEKEQRPGGAK